MWRGFVVRAGLVGLLCLAMGGGAWAALPWESNSGGGAVVKTPRVQAELLAYVPQGVHEGAEVWLGLKIVHQPGWHTYWKNPGDTGLPTTLVWDLPVGVVAGEIEWPAPKLLPVSDTLVNYGFEDVLLLPVPVTISHEFQGAELTVKLRADWLVCRIECIPEGGDFVLTIPAQQSMMLDAGLFQAAWAAAPQILEDVDVQVLVSAQPVQDAPGSIEWRVEGLPKAMLGQALILMPESEGIVNNLGPLKSRWEGDVWVASYALNAQRSGSPERMQAVLQLAQFDSQALGAIGLDAPVRGEWPIKQAVSIPPALQAGIDADRAAAQTQAAQNRGGSSLEGSAVAPLSFLGALLLALVGGLLLNLMPCVFPVLSIKAVTFAQSGGYTRNMHFATGMSYGLGVVLTMLALAGLMLILRATGAGLGWGFQLQSPVFVALLAGLFTLISLNLLGVFEVAAILPAGIGNLKSKTVTVDAFFSGIVSVLIATPCTAPFMGAALGVALVMPAWQSLLIFLALGIGLAFPLVLVACIPSLVRWLPRPGAWMVTFKTVMAFPMLATVLWLVWVIGIQTSIDGAVGLLAILLTLTLLVWVLGRRQQAPAKKQQGQVGHWIAVVISALILVVAMVWFMPALRQSGQGISANMQAGWQPWSPERVVQLDTQGKSVFIDFTAAWCVTCQLNKRTTLSQPEVLQAFADQDVVLLQADWTRYDPAITAELQRLGRSGVPVYVFQKPGQEPRLLPEVLTPGIVMDALNGLNWTP